MKSMMAARSCWSATARSSPSWGQDRQHLRRAPTIGGGEPVNANVDTFVTVVAPIRDAAEYVVDAVLEIDRVMSRGFRHYEIVLVDDASSDDTVQRIESL